MITGKKELTLETFTKLNSMERIEFEEYVRSFIPIKYDYYLHNIYLSTDRGKYYLCFVLSDELR